MSNLKCCGQDSKWVENVVNKGYFFCEECRKEVIDHITSTAQESPVYIPQDQVEAAIIDLYLTTTAFELEATDAYTLNSEVVGGYHNYNSCWVIPDDCAVQDSLTTISMFMRGPEQQYFANEMYCVESDYLTSETYSSFCHEFFND